MSETNGLSSEEVGTTFVADHVQNNGEISVSNIDHVYSSSNVSQRITQIKLVKNTSSDHHLVLVNYNPLTNKSSKTRKSYKRKITKRSMKNFNNEIWNEALSKKNWDVLNQIKDLDEQVAKFTDMVTDVSSMSI